MSGTPGGPIRGAVEKLRPGDGDVVVIRPSRPLDRVETARLWGAADAALDGTGAKALLLCDGITWEQLTDEEFAELLAAQPLETTQRVAKACRERLLAELEAALEAANGDGG